MSEPQRNLALERELNECASPHVIAALVACKAERDAAVQQRDDARRFGEDAAARYNATLNETTCAFCGTGFPVGTPRSSHAALDAHVRVCEAHPMRSVVEQRDAALAVLKVIVKLAQPMHTRCVVCRIVDVERDPIHRCCCRPCRSIDAVVVERLAADFLASQEPT